jgi:dihydroorotate dehydrogenase (NAD+) catalytic subunit
MKQNLDKIFTTSVVHCYPETPGSSVYMLQLNLGSNRFYPTAGQFIALRPLERTSVAPRPFTVVSYRDSIITLLVNTIGTNTRRYAQMKPGDALDLYGPYGKEIDFGQNCSSCIFVGGGIGNAALVTPVQKALLRDINVTVYLGAREKGKIPALSQFTSLPITCETITERGATRTGYVTQLLHNALRTDNGNSTVVACGPKIMLRKVHELCLLYNNPCIVIVEEMMMCEMGSCKGCAIFGGHKGKEVRHVCADGPAFDARWIDWEQFAPQHDICITTTPPVTDIEEISTTCILGNLTLATPFLNCSGTLDIDACEDGSINTTGIGAFVIKGLSLNPRPGNPLPRVCETPSGMLNSIGLEYIGVDAFLREILPRLRALHIPIIANINGTSVEEYCALTEQLNDADIAMIEVNISCPNVKEGGIAFGVSPPIAAKVTHAVKRVSRVPIIVKLTPNVTDIVTIARAVEDAGADVISLINTVLGATIDIHTRKPVLANIVGGLSGPAIRPIALRCVLSVAQAVHIPIIGMGGNENGYTAAEFMMAGATATAFGTASFANRTIFSDAITQLREVAQQHGFATTAQLVKSVILP